MSNKENHIPSFSSGGAEVSNFLMKLLQEIQATREFNEKDLEILLELKKQGDSHLESSILGVASVLLGQTFSGEKRREEFEDISNFVEFYLGIIITSESINAGSFGFENSGFSKIL